MQMIVSFHVGLDVRRRHLLKALCARLIIPHPAYFTFSDLITLIISIDIVNYELPTYFLRHSVGEEKKPLRE
jgi:hypothetical protein